MCEERVALETPEAHVTFRQRGNEKTSSPWTTFQAGFGGNPRALDCVWFQYRIRQRETREDGYRGY